MIELSIIIPILTLLGITAVRVSFGLDHNFGAVVDKSSLFTLTSVIVSLQIIFGVLGTITGSIWAKFTWSEHTDLFTTKGWWVNDVKLNGAAISTLIYLAYRILRNSLQEEHQKGLQEDLVLFDLTYTQ